LASIAVSTKAMPIDTTLPTGSGGGSAPMPSASSRMPIVAQRGGASSRRSNAEIG
jgi:hypothetical protein